MDAVDVSSRQEMIHLNEQKWEGRIFQSRREHKLENGAEVAMEYSWDLEEIGKSKEEAMYLRVEGIADQGLLPERASESTIAEWELTGGGYSEKGDLVFRSFETGCWGVESHVYGKVTCQQTKA